MADRLTDKIHGKIIICTFPKPYPDDFAAPLEEAGAEVLYMPAIEIRALPYHLKKDINSYDWIVFTSKNGIRFFKEELEMKTMKHIAVLGDATASELRKRGISPDFIGSGLSGVDFADELKQNVAPGESILLILGELAPNTLINTLNNRNPVDRINVYQTIAPDKLNPKFTTLIRQNQYDLMLISSPSAIKNLYLALQPQNIEWRLVSIGKTTTAACRDLQIEPLATAKESSYKGLAEATLEYLKNKKI
ncbi:uroporphyrinogen-III synthase [Mangrovibacterium sp.]|uniref:uroporphyrinogen-III synthase n=1 Tax=Mangrovibacterium sp. TaxID=1961364 RepID=UPI003565A131